MQAKIVWHDGGQPTDCRSNMNRDVIPGWEADPNDCNILTPRVLLKSNLTYGQWQHRKPIPETGGWFCWNHDLRTGEVKFGIWYDAVRRRPGYRGHWSSNESALLDYTGLKVVEVTDQGRVIRYLDLEHAPKAPKGYGLRRCVTLAYPRTYWHYVRDGVVTLRFGYCVLEEVVKETNMFKRLWDRVKYVVYDIAALFVDHELIDDWIA